jgi:proteasome accessory factor A
MSDRVMGLETEYASVWLGGEKKPGRQTIYEAVAEQVLAQLDMHFPVTKSIFLSNGGRLYFDDEAQPANSGLIEWATPECRTALQATLYDLVGEALLAKALPAAEAMLGGRLTLLKNNTDGVGHTYGCHENYLIPRKSPYLPNEADFSQYLVRSLIPFMVTRQILCGAGQIGRYGHARDEKVGFQLSQRADFMVSILSEDARGHRSIINTRNEPHADPHKYRRLHILVGDANVSPWCTWMKLGTTQLVLDMIDEMALDPVLTLVEPITGLRAISYNGYAYKVPVILNGSETTRNALEIQRQYLEAVKAFYQNAALDSDKASLIAEWEEVLEALDGDPFSLGDRVDWVTKLKLMREERLLNHQSTWDAPALGEINLRYHDIHPEYGLAPMLKKEGVIFYGDMSEVFDQEKIIAAARVPPQTTRARIRGNYANMCNLNHVTPSADWTRIKLGETTVQLDDPLEFSSPLVCETDRTLFTESAFLRDQLTSGHSRDIRLRAAQALGQFEVDTPDLVQTLKVGLKDSDWQVRAKTTELLGRLIPFPIDMLKEASQDMHIAVRQRAQNALNSQTGREYA